MKVDLEKVKKAAAREALGMLEVSDDPVPITLAGIKRTLKRLVIGALPVTAALTIFGLMKVLGLVPVYGG